MKRIITAVLFLALMVGGIMWYQTYDVERTFSKISDQLTQVEQAYQTISAKHVDSLTNYFEDLAEETQTGSALEVNPGDWTPIDGIYSAITVARKQVNRLGVGDYMQRLEALAAVQVSLHKIHRSIPIDHPAWSDESIMDLRSAVGESAPVRDEIEELNSAIKKWHKLLANQTGLVTAQMLGFSTDRLKYLGFEGELEEATEINLGES